MASYTSATYYRYDDDTSTSSNSLGYSLEYSRVEPLPKMESYGEKMDINKIKYPIIKALLKSKLVGRTSKTMVIATNEEMKAHLPNYGQYGLCISFLRDVSSSKNEVSRPNTYTSVIVLHALDKVSDFMQKANIIKEALTALTETEDPGSYGVPQLIIFSKTMHADELLDLVTYAGAKSSWENKYEDLEGSSITATMKMIKT